MLKNTDLHIVQIHNQLKTIEQYAAPWLEKNELKDDFKKSIEIIGYYSKFTLGDKKLEDAAKIKLSSPITLDEEKNCSQMKEYDQTIAELLAMQPHQWLEFETFRKNVIIPREQKNAPSTVPAVQNPDQIVENKVYFNLQERYNNSFNVFK